MDIAALSTSISQTSLHTEVGAKLLVKVMDTAEQQSIDLMKLMDSMNGLGNNIDIKL